MKSLYQIFELNDGATLEEVRKAYQRLVKIHHPDAGGSHDKFIELQQAYEILGDRDSKEKYDRTNRLLKTRKPAPPVDPNTGFGKFTQWTQSGSHIGGTVWVQGVSAVNNPLNPKISVTVGANGAVIITVPLGNGSAVMSSGGVTLNQAGVTVSHGNTGYFVHNPKTFVPLRMRTATASATGK